MVDHFQLGEVFFRQGEYVKACEEYEQAAELNYLPQLLKLKISGTGIELEKSSIDQIKTTQITTSLGINKYCRLS